MVRIVAIDPGGVTGLYGNECPAVQFEGEHHLELWEALHMLKPDTIVYERFHHRSMIQQDTASKPLEYIGVIKHYAQWREAVSEPVELVPQEASQAKDFWTNDKIKKLSLWVAGRPHAMDACRHFLWYVSFTLKDNQYINRLR